MKNFLVSFDARNDHERIIKDLLAKGWHSVIKGVNGNGEVIACNLPNTTWYKSSESAQVAYLEMQAIVGTLNLLRCTATAFNEWWGSGQNPMPHQIEEARLMGIETAA